MFRYYSPGTTLFALIAAGVMSLLGRSKRHRRPSDLIDNKTHAEKIKPGGSDIERIVEEHADYTAEVFDVFATGLNAEAIARLSVGDRVYLQYDDDEVELLVKGKPVASKIMPETSNLPKILEEYIAYDAYLGGREVAYSTDYAQFVSIIAFYKLDGVPPTKVNLNF